MTELRLPECVFVLPDAITTWYVSGYLYRGGLTYGCQSQTWRPALLKKSINTMYPMHSTNAGGKGVCVCRVVGGHARTGEEDKEARRLRFQLISFRPLILELFWLLKRSSSRSGVISAEQNYRSLAPDREQIWNSLQGDVTAQLLQQTHLKHVSGMCVVMLVTSWTGWRSSISPAGVVATECVWEK